jgi:hypothetical protein
MLLDLVLGKYWAGRLLTRYRVAGIFSIHISEDEK